MTSKKNEDDNFQQHRPSSPAISASGGSAALGGGIASRRAFGSASSSSSATSFESFSDQEGGAGGAGGYGFGSDYASGGVGGGGGGNRSFSAQGMRREASFIPKIKSFFSRALQNFTASGKKDSDPFARGGLLVDKSKPNIKKIALIAIVSIVSILLLYFVFGFLFSSSASSSSSSSSSSATYSSFSPNRNREANQKQQQQEQAQKQQQQRQEREREQPETPEPPPVLEERDPKLTFNFPKRKHQTYVPLYRELIQRQEFERNIIYRKRMSDEGKDLGEEIQVTQQLLINRKTAALASIFVPICASTGSQPYLGDTSSIFSSHLENGLEPAKSRISKINNLFFNIKTSSSLGDNIGILDTNQQYKLTENAFSVYDCQTLDSDIPSPVANTPIGPVNIRMMSIPYTCSMKIAKPTFFLSRISLGNSAAQILNSIYSLFTLISRTGFHQDRDISIFVLDREVSNDDPYIALIQKLFTDNPILFLKDYIDRRQSMLCFQEVFLVAGHTPFNLEEAKFHQLPPISEFSEHVLSVLHDNEETNVVSRDYIKILLLEKESSSGIFNAQAVELLAKAMMSSPQTERFPYEVKRVNIDFKFSPEDAIAEFRAADIVIGASAPIMDNLVFMRKGSIVIEYALAGFVQTERQTLCSELGLKHALQVVESNRAHGKQNMQVENYESFWPVILNSLASLHVSKTHAFRHAPAIPIVPLVETCSDRPEHDEEDVHDLLSSEGVVSSIASTNDDHTPTGYMTRMSRIRNLFFNIKLGNSKADPSTGLVLPCAGGTGNNNYYCTTDWALTVRGCDKPHNPANPVEIPFPLTESYWGQIIIKDAVDWIPNYNRYQENKPELKLPRCDIWFDRPTFFVARHSSSSPNNQMLDTLYTTYALIKKFGYIGNKDINIMIVDRMADSNNQFDLYYNNLFTNHPVLYLQDYVEGAWPPKGVVSDRPRPSMLCFDQAFLIGGYANLRQRTTANGIEMPSIDEFSQFILDQSGLGPLGPFYLEPPQEYITVTVIQRQKTRRILNAQELLQHILNREAETYDRTDCNYYPIHIEVVELESMNQEEKTRVFMRTDIVIAAHGAALTNLLFMPKHGVIIEVFPHDYSSDLYEKMALDTDRTYFPYHQNYAKDTKVNRQAKMQSKDADNVIVLNDMWFYVHRALEFVRNANGRVSGCKTVNI